MIGWFVSLLLVALFSVGAWIPGAVDGTLTRALQDRLGPHATASVHVTGDPLLQMPFGTIPMVEARLTGYRVADVPVRAVTMRLTDVQVAPFQAIVGKKAILTAPAGAWMAVEVDVTAVQAKLDQLVAAGAFSNMQAGLAFWGQKLTVSLLHPTVQLRGGRLHVVGEAEMQPSGNRVPFEASAGLAIEDGARLNLTAPELRLNGRALPAFLVGPQVARFNPLLDLSRLQLPPGEWRLLALELEPDGLTLKVGGELTALPNQ
jgi:hypothetical protein